MGQNKLISIKVPVLRAMQNMGIDASKDIPTITTWIAEAEKEIGSYYSFRKKWFVLTVNGFCAELPCDIKKVQAVVVGDYGTKCGDLFERAFISGTVINAAASDTFFVIDIPEDQSGYVISGLKWETQDGNLIFKTPLSNQKVTCQGLGLISDSEGFPMIMENHLPACIEYAMYRYAVRSRFSPNKMDHTDISRFARNWDVLRMDAIATDAEISDSDRQEIVALIADPFAGIS